MSDALRKIKEAIEEQLKSRPLFWPLIDRIVTGIEEDDLVRIIIVLKAVPFQYTYRICIFVAKELLDSGEWPEGIVETFVEDIIEEVREVIGHTQQEIDAR